MGGHMYGAGGSCTLFGVLFAASIAGGGFGFCLYEYCSLMCNPGATTATHEASESWQGEMYDEREAERIGSTKATERYWRRRARAKQIENDRLKRRRAKRLCTKYRD